MTDPQFHTLTATVADMFPYRRADSEINRLNRRFSSPDKPDFNQFPARIESNVWGWRILWPELGFSPVEYGGGFSILSEGLRTLDDAIRICDSLGIAYKVFDTQDPDPL